MTHIYPKAFYGDTIIDFADANLGIASSAVLYGLSVYTVFHVAFTKQGQLAFRLSDHYKRLEDSAKIIGIAMPEPTGYTQFVQNIDALFNANTITRDVFVRVSVHVDATLPGTRSRGLHTVVSMFAYDADAIVPRSGARLKTSLWRRVPDNAIPSRAKVNGAYVNSVLARQDAIDSGNDDCVFLDSAGHVCELSAANIFIVRDDVVITPDTHSDLLEGINRRSMLQIAHDAGYKAVERSVDLTELYIADEIFMCGTSAFITPVIEVDARQIGAGQAGPISERLGKLHNDALQGESGAYSTWLTRVGQAK